MQTIINKEIKEKEFYTAEEASRILGMYDRKMYYLRRKGIIKGLMRKKGALSPSPTWHISHNELFDLKKN